MTCEVCGKEDCEQLTSKSKYNGQTENREMCDECFEEVHGELP